MEDQINHPKHYGGGDNPYEAIKVIEAWGLGFCLGNAIKYIARAGKKDAAKELEDLKKSAWYLNREILRREELRISRFASAHSNKEQSMEDGCPSSARKPISFVPKRDVRSAFDDSVLWKAGKVYHLSGHIATGFGYFVTATSTPTPLDVLTAESNKSSNTLTFNIAVTINKADKTCRADIRALVDNKIVAEKSNVDLKKDGSTEDLWDNLEDAMQVFIKERLRLFQEFGS